MSRRGCSRSRISICSRCRSTCWSSDTSSSSPGERTRQERLDLGLGGGYRDSPPGPLVRAFRRARAGLGVPDQRHGAARQLRVLMESAVRMWHSRPWGGGESRSRPGAALYRRGRSPKIAVPMRTIVAPPRSPARSRPSCPSTARAARGGRASGAGRGSAGAVLSGRMHIRPSQRNRSIPAPPRRAHPRAREAPALLRLAPHVDLEQQRWRRFFASARFDNSRARETRSQVWIQGRVAATIFALFVCSAPMKCIPPRGARRPSRAAPARSFSPKVVWPAAKAISTASIGCPC